MTDTMDWEALLGRVSEFLGIDAESLGRGTHIYDELGLDSLGMFSLGMHLIKCFGVKLPLSEVANISTIGDIYEALERHRVTGG